MTIFLLLLVLSAATAASDLAGSAAAAANPSQSSLDREGEEERSLQPEESATGRHKHCCCQISRFDKLSSPLLLDIFLLDPFSEGYFFGRIVWQILSRIAFSKEYFFRGR